MPHACIGVDVITGFPGESDDHFMDTYQFLKDLEIDYIHAFTYSERDNTPAASMPDVVPVHVRRERSNVLRTLSQKKKNLHYAKHLGDVRNVLFENSSETDHLSGFTDNYIRILSKSPSSIINTIQPVELGKIISVKGEPYIFC
jgi:threonylcarbamoyladenosine tRNA methylthiotransferase MtaB